MKKIYSLFILLFAFQSLSAQWVDAGPGAGYISSVCSVNGSTYVSTDYNVYKLSDLDSKWKKIHSSNSNISGVISNSEFIFIAKWYGGVWRSSDNGTNWVKVQEEGQPITKIYSHNSKIYLTSQGKVFVSENNGTSWNNISNGLNSSLYIYSITSLDNYLVISSREGIFRFNEQSNIWQPVNNGLTSFDVRLVYAVGSRLYAFPNNGRSYLSDSYGNSWEEFTSSLGGTWYMNYLNGYLFACNGQGIYRSSDSGVTWQYSSSGLTNYSIMSMTYENSYYYAGTFGNGVFRSSDGLNWEQYSAGLNDLRISSIYAEDSFLLISGENGQIFTSNNLGADWQFRANEGMVKNFIKVGNDFYGACEWGGVIKSSDNGVSWIEKNNGLQNFSGRSVHYHNGSLFLEELINYTKVSMAEILGL